MPPRPFYSIPESSILFGCQYTPEEQVRQWVLFELLGAYNWPITSLQIEVPVQVGSRTFRADIVVFDNSIPVVVVECKRLEHKLTQRDLAQAHSYANSLGTRFSVLTNGRLWLAFRRVDNEWKAIIDIPKFERSGFSLLHQRTPSDRLHSFLWSTHSLQALMYWLYRSVPKDEISIFAQNLNIFFTSVDFNVHNALERSVQDMSSLLWSQGFFQDPLHESNCYAAHKLTSMCQDIQDFLTTKDGKSRERLRSRDLTVAEALRWLIIDIDEILRNSGRLMNVETHMCALIVSFARYFQNTFEKQSFSEWPAQFIQPLWSLIDEEFLPRFDLHLPKSHDADAVTMMRANGQNIVEHDVSELLF